VLLGLQVMKERLLPSTAVALNFNQIGIATAFIVGVEVATDADGLATYFVLITAACAVVTAGTFLQFEDKPPSHPSSSEIEKLVKGEEEPPFIESVGRLFGTPGFIFPLSAFIMFISVTNIVGAFIDEVMKRGGVTDQFGIDLAGAGFEFGIVLGGIIIGGFVDKTKGCDKGLYPSYYGFVDPFGFDRTCYWSRTYIIGVGFVGIGYDCGTYSANQC